MSNGDRDRGSEGKTATQDPYAAAADSTAARSRTGQGANGQGGNGKAGNGQGGSAGRNGSTAGANGRSGSNVTVAPPASASPVTAPAAKAPAGKDAAAPAPTKGSTDAGQAGPPAPKPSDAPTDDGPGLVQTWRQKLSGLTQKVLGSDDDASATSARTEAAPKKADGAVGKAGVTTGDKTSDKGANEPTAVVALPAAAAGAAAVVPAARVTGTRTAPGAPAPAKSAETIDTTKPKAGTPRRTRKARLRLSRLDPWSVMKTAFMFSIAGGIMLVVGVYAIWTVISSSGLFDSVNEIIAAVVSTPGDTTPFRVEDYVNTAKVMGVTAFLACIDVVIFTALATLFSFLYNLAATMLGGLEITLAED